MLARAVVWGCALAAFLAVAPGAGATRFAVGIAPGASRAVVESALREHGASAIESLAPIPAFLVDATGAARLRSTAGVRYVEALRVRRQAFVPNDPFLPRQWYAAQNRAFDAWFELPPLAPVRVAVIDSGIDGTHPELSSRIVATRSFVAGPATVDTQGHGTFVAGLIAAQTNDGVGIAGLAPAAELLIAKVVGPRRSIPVASEAKAIRWAVASGARIINMSLGGLRDPTNAGRDAYSQLEADAIAYAVSKNVLVVAAVGNSDQSPSQPWPYANWPAALPHVLGVSALGRNGGSPAFSNRDPRFNDIAAPGQDILSTFPLPLTARTPECVEQGYSSCGPQEYRSAEGTSFATPQVTAAAAMLIATQPTLSPDQVAAILVAGAVDAVPANGCGICSAGRDRYTGAGRLDATAALALLAAGTEPAPDRYEPNDDGGIRAHSLFGPHRQVDATLDFWNDRDDVYRVFLRRGQQLVVSEGGGGLRPALALWLPGTIGVADFTAPIRNLAARTPGTSLGYRARVTGWFILHVRVTHPGSGAYRLLVVKTR